MRIYTEISLSDFDAWSGGADTLEDLTSTECDKLEMYLEDMADEWDDTSLNDFLWLERDTIADLLGYGNWETLCAVHDKGDDETIYKRYVQLLTVSELVEEYDMRMEQAKADYEEDRKGYDALEDYLAEYFDYANAEVYIDSLIADGTLEIIYEC